MSATPQPCCGSVAPSTRGTREHGKLGQAALVGFRLADHAERELFKSGTSASQLSGFDVSPYASQLAFWVSEMIPPAAVRKTITQALSAALPPHTAERLGLSGD